MADDIVQVNFRMPADLKAALERAAEESRRSLTAEIVARLEASFRFPATGGGSDSKAEIRALLDSIRDLVTDDRERTATIMAEKLSERIRRNIDAHPTGKRQIDVD